MIRCELALVFSFFCLGVFEFGSLNDYQQYGWIESGFFLVFVFFRLSHKTLTIVNTIETYAHTYKNNAILRRMPTAFWTARYFGTHLVISLNGSALNHDQIYTWNMCRAKAPRAINCSNRSSSNSNNNGKFAISFLVQSGSCCLSVYYCHQVQRVVNGGSKFTLGHCELDIITRMKADTHSLHMHAYGDWFWAHLVFDECNQSFTLYFLLCC